MITALAFRLCFLVAFASCGVRGLEIWNLYPENVEAGSELMLVCSGQEPEELGWLYNGMHLEDEPGRQIQTEVDDYGGIMVTLTIPETSVDDSGNYKCADAGDYFNSDEVSVTVTGPAEVIVSITEPEEDQVTVAEGDDTTFRCMGEGTSELLVWNYPEGDAVNIVISDAVMLPGVVLSLLTIEGASAENAGEYTCTDSGQSVSASINLIVD